MAYDALFSVLISEVAYLKAKETGEHPQVIERQMRKTARVFGVSPDWIFGFTDDKHLNRSKPPMQRLREAVAAVGALAESN